MAQNMGFGSAVTGFGTGYLNALRQGRSEQSSLLSAKLRKDALDQKKQEASAAGSLRAMQMEDLIDARRDRRDAAKDRTANATNKLLFGANAKVSDFYAKMQPIIATMDPAQRKTTHDSMRASVRGMLTAGGMKPEDADGYAESLIKPYGMQLQDETVDVPVAPNMEKEGLLSRGIIPESSVGSLGAQTPELGQATPFSLQPDGTYGRVGKFAMDPTLRNMAGMVEVLKSNPAQLAYNASQGGRKPQEGFSQFAPSAYGATEQRSALTEQMPATATYGIDLKNQSLIGKNNASTELTKVRTQQLQDLFPDQAAFLKQKVASLGANIKNVETRTKFIGLNYELELRKHAAQTAHQQAMAAIQSGQLSNAQQNLALRKVGLRMKAIIDPERIINNGAAIISDLTRAMGVKGADVPALKQQIAMVRAEQKRMKEFQHTTTSDPRKLLDTQYVSSVLADTVGKASPELQAQLQSEYGLTKSPTAMYDRMLGTLPFDSPFYDSEDWGENDYMGNSEDVPIWNPMAGAAQTMQGRMTGGAGRRPISSPNGGIPGFTR
jgi:hypothetical protein